MLEEPKKLIKMLTIQTATNTKNKVKHIISSIERLDELVVVTDNKLVTNNKIIYIENGKIRNTLAWHDTEPPFLFPEIQFSPANLLAFVFYKLGNHQKAFEYISAHDKLYNHLLIATNLQFGYKILQQLYAETLEKSLHNACVIQHYGILQDRYDITELKKLYQKAIANAENDELKIFTAKHYTNLLLDSNAFKEAEDVIRSLEGKAISDEAKNALNVQLASALMAQLSVPYNENTLDVILNLLEKSIAFYENKNLKVNAGLLLIDASEIANFKNDFIGSKELITRAIRYFKEENITEFLGEAMLRKATLLYTWSKNGSPQYYKPAINAFQDTLKVFKRDTHPQKFADIHHNLALIYSEIPVASEEKPIWTAFCASSFKEALQFYTKENYPYEYAMASHNYATALMNFPKAKMHNNLDKAAQLFEEALTVRTVEKYPFERALTLLNLLELGWLTHNEDSSEERKKYEQMHKIIKEIKTLVTDENLIRQANNHLEQLEQLKTVL